MTVPDIKVYTVNGPSTSSSLPDWITKKIGKKKHQKRERIQTSLQLIQDFTFPQTGTKIKTTRDGHHAIGIGTYKPQMRCWDLDQLTLKFERVTDSEGVDFVILSDDWTKTLHLQADRSLELHTQGGFHYRTRIPRPGRSLGYHWHSCDAYVAATGKEVYRLNLNEGRFMKPLNITGTDDEPVVEGINVVDINPAHSLIALGLDGEYAVEFWDPRSQARAGLLKVVPPHSSFSSSEFIVGPNSSITALSSHSNGLSLAVGTSSGYTMLYDLRSPNSLASKDQGYGSPITSLSWLEGLKKGEGKGEVLMAGDRKVVKVWEAHDASHNLTTHTPSQPISYVHHVPHSGLFMLTHEASDLSTLYVPGLGRAPRWCSFLDSVTEEMENGANGSIGTGWEDYRFVERNELARLGLDSLLGTPALRPYMHGYFVHLKLYDTARVAADPIGWEHQREKVIKEKMEKLADSRIRTRKGDTQAVKVNQRLAAKIQMQQEKEERKAERLRKKKLEKGETITEGGTEERDEKSRNLLNDSRFKAMFEDPAFEVDESSREWALLNPSSIASTLKLRQDQSEDDKQDDDGNEGSGEEEDEEGLSSSEHEGDSSEDDDLVQQMLPSKSKNRYQPYSTPRPMKTPKLVPMQLDESGESHQRRSDADGTESSFGRRRRGYSAGRRADRDVDMGEAGAEISWVPSSDKSTERGEKGDKRKKGGSKAFTLQRGGVSEQNNRELSESERKGRTHRRTGIRSGSRNVFRRL